MFAKYLSLFVIFLSYMIFSTARWVVHKFGEVTYEQVLFHLNVPLDSDIKLIKSFLQNTVLIAIIVTIIAYFVAKKISIRKFLSSSCVLLVLSLVFLWYKFNINDIIKEYHNRTVMGTFYEENYVASEGVKIVPPENKRNLIMIFAESMESTYADTDYFGDNLIPRLAKIAEDNIYFSDTKNLGGFKEVRGAHYTQASLVAQLCAVPLRLPIDVLRFRPANGFLPGVLCLSDVLDKEGYKQSFMIGTSRHFGNTDKYLETHGNVKILDWDFYAKRDHLSKRKDKKHQKRVRDADLFEHAKDELSELSSSEKPFAFTIMTMDTHFGTDHFDDKNCQIKYHDDGVKDENNLRNVISCSDKQISDFIGWIKSQPFFENTEIVVVGDHFVMGEHNFGKDWNRTIYNVYINTEVKNAENRYNRNFTALDTMPTVLESMGYHIEGHKIGLGVSLLSGEKTLLEKIGDLDTLSEELNMQSAVYNKILYGK